MSVSKNPPKLERTAEFAWPGGDRPGRLEFSHPVPEELQHALLDRLAELRQHAPSPADRVTALMPPKGPLGRFRVMQRDRELFVRVSARWAHPQLEQALSGFLAAHGIAVNHLEVAGAEFGYGGKSYRLDVRPLLAARHFDGSLEDIRSLALSLRSCHAVLRDFPAEGQVRTLAEERFGRLQQVVIAMRELVAGEQWERLSRDPHWGARHADWLRQMVAEADLRFDLEPGAQCLHAQVHRGNVLYRLNDNAPVLLDFEDAVHTFAAPLWDTAHLVQRFCLHDAPPPETLAGRLATVREAYGAPVADLSLMMRRIAWFSMAILVGDHLYDGASAPPAEYDKFVFLETQARSYAAHLG